MFGRRLRCRTLKLGGGGVDQLFKWRNEQSLSELITFSWPSVWGVGGRRVLRAISAIGLNDVGARLLTAKGAGSMRRVLLSWRCRGVI